MEFRHSDEVVAGEGFRVVADRRVFAMMSFLNAFGYDKEYEGVEMHPVRVRVRERLQERLATRPELASEWQSTYEELEMPVWVYLDYSLSLAPDVPFERVRPESEWEYAGASRALEEAGFPALLNDFWEVAGLAEIWEQVKPAYREELERYDFDAMAAQLDGLWRYLRMPRQDDYVLVNVPNLLDTHYQAIGAQYGRYYYQVESPGSHSYGLNLHEYLHSIVNPLIDEHFANHEEILTAYYEAGKDGDFAASYQHPGAVAYESIVRAIDYRLRVLTAEEPSDVEQSEARVRQLTEGGLTLVAPFYELLETEFESDDRPFETMLPLLLEELPTPEEVQPEGLNRRPGRGSRGPDGS